ncbi:SNF2-related protein [Okeania sp.]|uniref:SNF2-related protein n=1 Tax=Okeania sp. TaxID=3100323 RepID=UPI002B4AF948|nr:SNF2-related protein [Okeania sp.]MEB3339236.1 SNF2-related protein [Okeania sp.]
MAILHSFWLTENQQPSSLFVWGEAWQKITEDDAGEIENITNNPYAITLDELLKLSEENTNFSLKKDKKSTIKTLAIPTKLSESNQKIYPIHSGTNLSEISEKLYFYPWQIEGICLEPLEAIKFLQSIPLGKTTESFIGGDLKFWSHVARWSLDLLARCKFLPSIEQTLNQEFIATWQPLLDSSKDQTRLKNFTLQMPLVCRTYNLDWQSHLSLENLQNLQIITENNSAKFPLVQSSQEIIQDFLKNIIDTQIRQLSTEISLIKTTSLHPSIRQWLKSLLGKSSLKLPATKETQQISRILDNWKSPLQEFQTTEKKFITCFRLYSPSNNSQKWQLEYCLQAVDNPEFFVDAKTIWENPVASLNYQGKTIELPQETLLKGLGLASRIYPIIEPSLQEATPQYCLLTPQQAYEFIKSGSSRFTDSGLGVILPPSLANREGWASRLGLSIQATAPKTKKTERLGLKSLLNFQWQLSIGGQKLTKAEFDKLVAKDSPLVEVNGEWVELQPQDVRAAQNFFATRQDQMALSLEDALRLATGDTQTVEKLPVVNFETGGQLQELLDTLTNNRSLEEIPTPENFQGELREYQARGVSWLTFLERWGLGACLADSMGLGKCVSHDTELNINSMVLQAEEIWQVYAGEAEFDGEGFWAKPNRELLVNSLDETTGKIVVAPIRRLYRQQVREKLRRVRLKDKSSIVITKSHKLFIRDSWKNDFQVGDYVCVPAKLVWDGKAQDKDLVKFLAWQIAEGYEAPDMRGVVISQKNKPLLAELLKTLENLSKRYGIKINRPAIRPYSDKKDCYQLIIHSVEYRKFLEGKGYKWGKRSLDKTIPSFIMQADLESIRIFLRNYFDAEGSANKTIGNVEISTASSLLIQQLSILLRRFGIWMTISPKQKRATNGTGIFRTYYIGTFSGNSARRFLQEIGFNQLEKQEKLKSICDKKANSNVEGIPASDIVAEVANKTKLPLLHLGIHSKIYIDGSQEFSPASLEKVINSIEHIISGTAEEEYRQLKPSKWTTKTLEAYSLLNILELEIQKTRLQKLLNQEVYYCQIESIEDIEYEGWVYDFEISKHHNFVANNILCHNTIQTIAFLLNQQEKEALESPTLLVCPTSVLGNWEREVKKFGPTLKLIVHHGDKRAKGKEFAKAVKDKHLVITSYALLHRDEKILQTIKWQSVIVDEAQNIKNPDAKQSQAVRKLDASFRMALTGTPVENRLSELWSILDFLNPGYLGQKQFFQRRFAIPIEKYGDTNSLQTLRSLVQPFILRRLKTDKDIIQDLPEKQENTIFCPLANEQAKLYQNIVENSLAEIEAADGIQRKGKILALLVKLKQLCNHPVLLQIKKGSKKKVEISDENSGKLQRIGAMLEEIMSQGERAIIFTQFAEWGKILQPYLQKILGREILYLYGATRKNKREEMVDQFQLDPQGPPIMILSLKAGGTGLNLTRANHVFHFDRWWNPAVENQATDRVFRIGQTRNVQVHKFVCTGTLEEKIHDIIESKKELAEQVVGTGEQWLTELDTEQLRNLLIFDRNKVIEEE